MGRVPHIFGADEADDRDPREGASVTSPSHSDTGAPVFVVGCARSGTTLLYHMLVSSGMFVDYRSETHLFDMLVPRFTPFESRKNLNRFLDVWLDSRSFLRTELKAGEIRRRIVSECSSPGDLMRLVGEAMAREQDRPRWAECTPLHLLYMEDIKGELPDALFLHAIRDGRSVALSLRQLGWVHALPWDRRQELLVAGWNWEWMLQRGRAAGEILGESYMEVRFEDLVTQPEETLKRVSRFVGCELDYGLIADRPIGSVASPNTAFGAERDGGRVFDPLRRWERSCTSDELRDLEATIGRTLASLGYDRSVAESDATRSLVLNARKELYHSYRTARQWLKDHTRMSRILTRSYLEDV